MSLRKGKTAPSYHTYSFTGAWASQSGSPVEDSTPTRPRTWKKAKNWVLMSFPTYMVHFTAPVEATAVRAVTARAQEREVQLTAGYR